VSRPELRVIEGGGDVVDYLEDLLESARKGEFEAVAVATVGSDGILGVGCSYRDDMDSAWARILASVVNLQHWLLDEGL
jgi:hypothetical protein